MKATQFNHLETQYQALRTRRQEGAISQEEFISSVHKLRVQDTQGVWWTIQPETGSFLKYQDGIWQPGRPPVGAPPGRPKRIPAKEGGGFLTSPLAVGLMSFGSAGLWLIYSNLRAGQEIWDLITPLIMGGVPFMLRLYQEKIDQALQPVYDVTTQFPFAMRTGAAFALPVVIGLLTSTANSYGYGALRLTALISILGAYILTRKVGDAGN